MYRKKERNKFCIQFYKLYYFVHVFYVDVFVFKRFHFIFLNNVVEAFVCTCHTHAVAVCTGVIIITEKTAN